MEQQFSQAFWNSLPGWVSYVAMNHNLEWVGYENEPAIREGEWHAQSGRTVYLFKDFRATLNKRPDSGG